MSSDPERRVDRANGGALCFGEVLLRLTPRASRSGPTSASPFFAEFGDGSAGEVGAQPAAAFDAWWGGSETNVAVGIAQLQQPAALITTLPDSELGRAARAAIERRGVEVLAPSSEAADARLGLYFAATQAEGKTIFYDRSNSAFALAPPTPDAIPWERFRSFHTSGINAALSHECLSATRLLLAAAREQGLATSFDLNLRSQLWSDSAAGAAILPMLETVDLLIGHVGQLASAFDLEPIDLDHPEGSAATLRAFAVESRIKSVVATDRQRAKDGSASDARVRLRALGVGATTHRVVTTPWFEATDRIGSGDAFTAGLLAALAQDRSTAEETDAECHGLRIALETGLAAASLANQSRGDFPTFDLEQVENRRAEFFTAHES